MSRLNDTKALTTPMPGLGVSVTREVRKIDNGYVERTSTYNEKTGQYKTSEKFCDSDDGGGASAQSGVGNEGLSDTKKYLGNDV